MRKKLIIPILAIMLIVGLCASTMAGGHGHKAPKKVGILLVAFGSSEPSAQVSFENIDKKTKAAYPGHTHSLGLYISHYSQETG